MKMSPSLQAPQRAFDVLAEDAVELSAGKPVERELELQRGDVPGDPPVAQRARPEAMTREAAEGAARLRPRHAVHRDPRATLQLAHGAFRQRPPDPVDRAVVEPTRVQRDLERGDGGAGCGARRGGGGGGGGDERAKKKTAPLPEM